MSKKDKGLLETEKLLLKGRCIDLFAHKLTCSMLLHRGSSSKIARDIQGGNKLTNLRMRPGGAEVRVTLWGWKYCWLSSFLCWALLISWLGAGRCQILALH